MLKELRELRRFARDSSLAAFLSAIVGHVTTLLMVSYAKFNMGLSKKRDILIYSQNGDFKRKNDD